jgi:SAM-dependent methyltransferase
MQSNLNHPTVSSPTVMETFPRVRDNERDTLFDYVSLKQESSVLDIQAAGGYLSDEVYRRLQGQVTVVCIEPSPELRARLNPAYTIIDNPVEDFNSVADHSIDTVLGLIALHHSNSHIATIGEAFRVLKTAGEMVICDVYEDSRLADWLNIFVGTHCPGGHTGNFPAAGSVRQLCEQCGFVDVVEEPRDVPWIFSCRADIAEFFQGLFGLKVSTQEIDAALDDYFTIRHENGRVIVEWQLMYCHARKPG